MPIKDLFRLFADKQLRIAPLYFSRKRTTVH